MARSINLTWFYGRTHAFKRGLEALGEIKETNPEIEVIIMTAYGSSRPFPTRWKKAPGAILQAV